MVNNAPLRQSHDGDESKYGAARRGECVRRKTNCDLRRTA